MRPLAIYALRYAAYLLAAALFVCGTALWHRDIFILDHYFAPPTYALVLFAIGATLLTGGFFLERAHIRGSTRL